MAGYSGKPLPQKLGIKAGRIMRLLHAPAGYAELIGLSTTDTDAQAEWVQAFYTERETFESEFDSIRDSLSKSGQFWVSWPKKSSKVPTDLDENIIREHGLKHGLVDVKVAAIDDTWSGLKFVFRTKDRN